MQDDEGYTVLNLRPREKTTTCWTPRRTQDSPLSSQCYKLLLGTVGAVFIILTLAVIRLSVLVFQGCLPQPEPDAASSVPRNSGDTQRNSPSCEPNRSLEELVSFLNQSLCYAAHRPSTDGSGCKLCPVDWLLNQRKCYWVSKENAGWNTSQDDCSAKGAHLLVLQDGEEMEFLHNFTQGQYPAWLGLRMTSPEKNWSWVDDSMLDQTLFSVWGPDDVNSCGMIKGNRIHSETCTAEFRWICQKEAVSL